MFSGSKLVILLEWELMSTLAEIVSFAMMGWMSIAKREQFTPLMALMWMVQLQKEAIPLTLLSITGE